MTDENLFHCSCFLALNLSNYSQAQKNNTGKSFTFKYEVNETFWRSFDSRTFVQTCARTEPVHLCPLWLLCLCPRCSFRFSFSASSLLCAATQLVNSRLTMSTRFGVTWGHSLLGRHPMPQGDTMLLAIYPNDCKTPKQNEHFGVKAGSHSRFGFGFGAPAFIKSVKRLSTSTNVFDFCHKNLVINSEKRLFSAKFALGAFTWRGAPQFERRVNTFTCL